MKGQNPFETLLSVLLISWVAYQIANPLLNALRDRHFVRRCKKALLRVIMVKCSTLIPIGKSGALVGIGRKVKKAADSLICSSKRLPRIVDKTKAPSKKILHTDGVKAPDPAWLAAPPSVLNRFRYALLFQVHYG